MGSSESSDGVAQLRRGVLELAILKLLSEEPNYGYEIIQRLSRFDALAVGENTIYPLLRRLKGEGLLQTHQMPSAAGPPRQIYRPTEAGHHRRRALQAEWQALVEAVSAVGGGTGHD